MLSKVSKDNVLYATIPIKKYSESNDFDIIQDNLDGFLLVKKDDKIFLWNYKNNRRYIYNRIRLEINNKFFYKQIESFDQNNIKQANYIRKSVIEFIKIYFKCDGILGIGGEYYIYFPFIKSNTYIGFSNHKSIVEDAYYNFPESVNYLVDYNNMITFPKIQNNITYDIIINVINIHENIIKYICNYNIKNIIIITCKPLHNKIKMLDKYLILKKIRHIQNINSLITICLFNKI